MTDPFLVRRRRWRVPLSAVLVIGFGSLMLVAVASVLALGLANAGRTTVALMNDRAVLALGSIEARLRSQLDPIPLQSAFVARSLEAGRLSLDEPDMLLAALTATIASTPQVTSIEVIDWKGRSATVAVVQGRPNGSMSIRDPAAATRWAAAQWTPPHWDEGAGQAVTSFVQPIRDRGQVAGLVSVSLGPQDLSRFLTRLPNNDTYETFILYDRTQVFAHPDLILRRPPSGPSGVSLPTYDDVGDPVLSAFVEAARVEERFRANRNGAEEEGPRRPAPEYTVWRADVPEIGRYLYVTKDVRIFADRAMTIGIGVPEAVALAEFNQLAVTAFIGAAILLLSVVVALILGRIISRRVGRLATAAAALRDLDFETVRPLPDSRLKELSEASRAFNAMVSGLRWFQSYVPRALVLRLVSEARDTALKSETREVTVMFSDIRGYTSLSEAMEPDEAARLLNHVLGLQAGIVEEEGGTIDKFIGDAVMAFWGAPDPQIDHRRRALVAARRIAEAVEADCRDRRARGLVPLGVRIGLHAGPALLGNIGSPSRLNYTVIGDTVNTASRIENLGREDAANGDAVVLASSAVIEGAEDETPLWERIGPRAVAGRVEPIEIWRLQPR